MPEADLDDVEKLVEMIAESKKPMLICGGGVVRSLSLIHILFHNARVGQRPALRYNDRIVNLPETMQGRTQ